MTQKHISKEIVSPKVKPSARQVMWNTMRANSTFTLDDIALASKRDTSSVRAYVKLLILAEIVEELVKNSMPSTITNKQQHMKKFYRLVQNKGYIAPRFKSDGTPLVESREQMWRTMKMLHSFTYVDLAFHSSTDLCHVAETDAADYCKHLYKAGYLRLLQASTHKSKALYALLSRMNTGLYAPKVQRTKCVFDPNLKQIIWHESIKI